MINDVDEGQGRLKILGVIQKIILLGLLCLGITGVYDLFILLMSQDFLRKYLNFRQIKLVVVCLIYHKINKTMYISITLSYYAYF